MKIFPTPFAGLLILEPRIYRDERGYFFESWNQQTLSKHGLNWSFVQDNQSCSQRDVIRGLHFQVPPFEQGKLVRVISGSVLDVVVDLRKDEPTYGQHFRMQLSAGQNNMLYIPAGFAHGFRTLEDNTIFFYKCTKVYDQASERSLRWDDPRLQIDWETSHPVLSARDQEAPLFDSFVSPF